MVVEKREDNFYADIYWDDLSKKAQQELLGLIGNNGNYDVFPIASINISQEDE